MAQAVAWLCAAGLFLYGSSRFLIAAWLPATRRLTGDFASAFPNPYFARMRPEFPTDQVWNGWNYGPVLHILTLPLFLVPRWSWVPGVWAMVNLVALAISFTIICRLSGAARRAPRPAIVMLVGLWLLFQPLITCFSQGNIEIVELAMILAAIVALERGQGGKAGLLLGLATMTKYLPGGFVAWLILRRQWRPTIVALCTIAVLAVLTAVTLDWRHSISLGLMTGVGLPSGFHELSVTSLFLHGAALLDADGPLVRWFPSTRFEAATHAGKAASVLIGIAYAVILYARRRRPISALEVSVLFMTMFMIQPWNHDYYYIFGLVGFSVLFLRAMAERQWMLLSLTLLAYVLISPPIPYSWVDRTGWFGLSFAYVINFHSIPLFGGFLLWLTLTHQMLREPGDAMLPAWMTPGRRRGIGLAIATAGVVVIAVLFFTRAGRPSGPATTQAVLQPPGVLTGALALALAPDGQRLAYIANVQGQQTLCVRTLEREASTCWPEVPDVEGPFFSPDGQSIGFFTHGVLMKVAAAGGPAGPVNNAPFGGSSASWGAGDRIVMSTAMGIYRLAASGDEPPELVVRGIPETMYFAPIELSSGNTLVFTVVSTGVDRGVGTIVAQSLTTGERIRLLAGTQAQFDAGTGRLIYALGGRVLAAAFDPDTLRLSSLSLTLVSNVLVTATGGAQFAVAPGALVYFTGLSTPPQTRALVWVDRTGRVTPLAIPPNAFEVPRVSPDGRTLAVVVHDVTTDLWTYDLATGLGRRVTFAANQNDTPVWRPDGRALAFAVPSWVRHRQPGELPEPPIFWPFGVPGSGPPRPAALVTAFAAPASEPGMLWQARLTEDREPVQLSSWSRDGRLLAGTRAGSLWFLETAHDDPFASRAGEPKWVRTTLAKTPFVDRSPTFSPDGRWIAFASDRRGHRQVYVQSYPALGDEHQVSVGGGAEPHWSSDGRELFYRNGAWLQAVSVTPGATPAFGPPHGLFHGPFEGARSGATNYDVSPDGRFLMIQPASSAVAQELRIVRSWAAGLARE